MFIYDCAGSSLLWGLFPSCEEWGLFFPHCNVQASYCGGFSCCLQALEHSLNSCGPWACSKARGSSQTRGRICVSCIGRRSLCQRSPVMSLCPLLIGCSSSLLCLILSWCWFFSRVWRFLITIMYFFSLSFSPLSCFLLLLIKWVFSVIYRILIRKEVRWGCLIFHLDLICIFSKATKFGSLKLETLRLRDFLV